MTKSQKKIRERFKLHLRNSVHEITEAIEAIDDADLGYCEKEHEDAHSCIYEALKDIREAVLMYEKKCDWIDLT